MWCITSYRVLSLGWKTQDEGRKADDAKEFSLEFCTNDSTTCSQQIFVSIYDDSLSWGGLVWVFRHSWGVHFSDDRIFVYTYIENVWHKVIINWSRFWINFPWRNHLMQLHAWIWPVVDVFRQMRSRRGGDGCGRRLASALLCQRCRLSLFGLNCWNLAVLKIIKTVLLHPGGCGKFKSY